MRKMERKWAHPCSTALRLCCPWLGLLRLISGRSELPCVPESTAQMKTKTDKFLESSSAYSTDGASPFSTQRSLLITMTSTPKSSTSTMRFSDLSLRRIRRSRMTDDSTFLRQSWIRPHLKPCRLSVGRAQQKCQKPTKRSYCVS